MACVSGCIKFPVSCTKKMADGMSGPDNVVQCLPLACTASNRYVSNTHVFVSCCEASLKKSYETVAIYCADLMDNRFNVV